MSDPSGFPGFAGAGDAIGRAVWAGPGPMAIVEHADGEILAVNDAMLALLGLGRDDLVGHLSRAVDFWLNSDERTRAIDAFRASDVQRDVPIRLRDAAGAPLEVLVTLSPATFADRACLVVMVSDITERRRLESSASSQRDRLAVILDVLPVGVVVHAISGEIVASNHAAGEILGLTVDQLTGRSPFDPRWQAIQPDGSPLPGSEHPAMITLRTGEPQENVMMGVRRPDSSLVWIAVSSRMSDRAGADGGPAVVATFMDITSLEEARRQLEVARDLAEEADRAKSNFLSIISHELRTPLTAVMGYSQMLLAEAGGPLTDLQREDLVQIARGADRLLALIDDLLDLGRIQTGRMELDLEYLDLAGLLKELEADLRVQAAAKGISFWMLAEPGLTVLADARRLEQVILNLVSNAVKFTHGGQVRVDAVRDGRDALITVEDSGVGIPQDAVERIFDLFQQGDVTTTRRFGGLGIGLAIARSIVERHGGSIAVSSVPGEGSTFSVRLPLER